MGSETDRLKVTPPIEEGHEMLQQCAGRAPDQFLGSQFDDLSLQVDDYQSEVDFSESFDTHTSCEEQLPLVPWSATCMSQQYSTYRENRSEHSSIDQKDGAVPPDYIQGFNTSSIHGHQAPGIVVGDLKGRFQIPGWQPQDKLPWSNTPNLSSTSPNTLETQYMITNQAMPENSYLRNPSASDRSRPSGSRSRTTHLSSITQTSTAPTSLLTSSTLGALAVQPAGSSNQWRSSRHRTQSDLMSESSIPSERISEGSASGTTLKCPRCPAIFTGSTANRNRNLRRHLQSQHSSQARLECPKPDCDTSFGPGRLDNLNRHLQQQHGVTKHRKRKADEISDVYSDADVN